MKVNTTESLSEQIYSIHNLQQEYIQTRLKEIGLNTQQARTLNYIFITPGTIQKKLAVYLGKQDATVTNLLKNLEKKDYLLRKIPDENERQKQLYLTDKGKAAVEKIQTIFNSLEQAFSDILSESEQVTAMQLMQKIRQQLPK
jgi:DNA-binding MarR family transcriptional regulator